MRLSLVLRPLETLLRHVVLEPLVQGLLTDTLTSTTRDLLFVRDLSESTLP